VLGTDGDRLLWTVGKYWSLQGNKRVDSRGEYLTQNLEVSTLEYRQECRLSWLRCFVMSSVLPSECRKIFCSTPSYCALNPFETTKLGHVFPYIQRSITTAIKWHVIPEREKRLFCIPNRPDCLWGPPTFLFSGKLALLISGSSINLTTYFSKCLV